MIRWCTPIIHIQDQRQSTLTRCGNTKVPIIKGPVLLLFTIKIVILITIRKQNKVYRFLSYDLHVLYTDLIWMFDSGPKSYRDFPNLRSGLLPYKVSHACAAAKFWPQRWLVIRTMPCDQIGCRNHGKKQALKSSRGFPDHPREWSATCREENFPISFGKFAVHGNETKLILFITYATGQKKPWK